MLPHPSRAPRSGLAALAALLLAASVSRAQETAGPSPALPTLHPRGLNAIVRMAVIEAHRRLGNPQCQQIFSDFDDASDRTLKAKLEEIGQTGQSYLGWIWFVDGGSEGRCAQAEVSRLHEPREPGRPILRRPLHTRDQPKGNRIPGDGGHPRGAPLARPRRGSALEHGDHAPGGIPVRLVSSHVERCVSVAGLSSMRPRQATERFERAVWDFKTTPEARRGRSAGPSGR